MNKIPVHILKIMNILAMHGFVQDINMYNMRNKKFTIYFYGSVIHKMKNNDLHRTFMKGDIPPPITEYSYSDEDIFKLLEDIK